MSEESRRLIPVLIGLIVATVASTVLTLGIVGLHHQPIWSAIAFAIALLKARFVVAYFMDLKSHAMIRIFDLWFVLMAAAYAIILS